MSDPIEVQRLWPRPGAIRLADLARAARADAEPPAGRPLVLANFAATVDGKVAIDGRSGPIGDAADRELFHHLRAGVDAVLAGTTTLEVERYGRLVRDAERRAERERAGLAGDPLAVVISRSGRLPLDIPLFSAPEQTVIVCAPHGTDVGDPAADVRVEPSEPEDLEPPAVLAMLARKHGVRRLLCEGGPTLLAGLAAADVVDELWLTVAPKLAAGQGPTLAGGERLAEPLALRLRHVAEHDGSLLLRYRR